MKGKLHPRNDVTLNPSGNASIHDVIERVDGARRQFLKTSISASVTAAVAGALGGAGLLGYAAPAAAAPIPPSANGFGGIGFDSIPPSLAPVVNEVRVPPGYRVNVLAAWGQPIMPGAPEWAQDATQDAAAQMKQFGMHNDGMHFFPFPGRGGLSNDRGLLCVNHEYTHEEILHGAEGLGGGSGVTLAKVRKSQAAHGVSVVELRRSAGQWGIVKGAYGRRITANTRMRVSGPAAGHPLLKSRKYDLATTAPLGDNDGFTAFGTLNNCAHGYTPWGTYLTCEENWNGYFGAPSTVPANNDFSRYGVTQNGFGYRWHEVDPRFDVNANPLEPNLAGWCVEIDPFDPASVPVKRTALGRFKHESAQLVMSAVGNSQNRRVAFYQGDDERNEYIYKFVAAGVFNRNNRAANRNLLDHGTLYVARFDSTPAGGEGKYRGVWLALKPDSESVINHPTEARKLKLRELSLFGAPAQGVANMNDAEVQALILIRTRQAADALGATMMDRPEWTAVRTYGNGYGYNTEGLGQGYNAQYPLEVYCTLTNNNRRGGGGTLSSNKPDGTTAAGSARPPVDVANPRPDNDYGHIIRWREDGNVVTATAFEWDIFTLAGDTLNTKTLAANYLKTNFIGVDTSDPQFNRKIYAGNIVDSPDGSADFGAPDGLWFDQFGRLWVQTDQQGDGGGDFTNIGSNVMVCVDPNTREARRFLTSPPNCEVTGVINTPDGRTMFVGIQHPGEDSTAANPTQFSNWPQSQFAVNSAGEPLARDASSNPLPVGANVRPRSSVLVITREDGGVIGA